MRETVEQFTCDRCRAVGRVVSIKYWIGYCAGAVSQEDDLRVKDYCFNCVQIAFQRVVNTAKCFEQATEMMEVSLDEKPFSRKETH